MSREGDSPVHTPRSTTSFRTIQRRNRLRRLQALPAEGPREKGADSRAPRHTAVRGAHIHGKRPCRKGLEARSDISCSGNVTRKKESLNRSRLSKHALQDEHQCGEVAAADPAVHEERQPPAVRCRIELPHECRGPGGHDGQKRLDRVEHAGNPSKGQAGRAETDDFAVLCRAVAPNDVHGIAGRVQMIERVVEPLKRLPQLGTLAGAAPGLCLRQPVERFACQPVHGPLVHGPRPDAPVEADCPVVPVQD